MSVTIDGSSGVSAVNSSAVLTTANYGTGTVVGNSIAANTIQATNMVAGSIEGAVSTPFSFRNKIINGGFDIWQRGTSVTNPTTSAGAYFADRWQCLRGGYATGVSAQQLSGVSGFRYYVRVQRNPSDTATTMIQLGQCIETANCLLLAGNTVTASFYVRTGTNFSGTLTGRIKYSTSADYNITINGGTDVSTVSITPNASFTRVSVTGTVPSNAQTVSLEIDQVPSGTAGANDYFEVGQVQLEVGSVATPFEQRPVGLELSLCQRYYQKSVGYSITPGASTHSGFQMVVPNGLAGSTAGNVGLPSKLPFMVEMRTTPTTRVWSWDGVLGKVGTSASYRTGASLAILSSSGDFQLISFDTSSAVAIIAGDIIWFQWDATAEL